MNTPPWMNNPRLTALTPFSWDDVVSVDTTSDVYQSTGSATIQLGININGELTGQTANLLSPSGLYSLPIPGTLGQPGTKVLSVVTNNEYFSFATRDYINQQTVGSIKPGETAVYAPGSQAVGLWKLDGSISLVTSSDNTATGQTVGLSVAPTEINIGNQYGSIIINSSGISLTVGTCSVVLTTAGQLNINGQIVNIQASMASIAGTAATFVGANALPAPPLAALHGIAGPSGVPSTNVFIGP